MKKLTRKLLVSIIAVAFAFAALGTSTYAWFSMNTTVTVSNMQLSAKSDNTYLLISDTKTTAEDIQADGTIAVNFAMGETKVYPSAPKLAADCGEGKLFPTGTPVTNATTAAVAANWYTAAAASPDASAINNATAVSLVPAGKNFSDFVIKKTVYLTVAVGANSARDLTVTAAFAQKEGGTDVNAIKALIVTNDNACAILSTSNYSAVDIKGDNTPLTQSSVLTVDIYLYVDGNATEIRTNNSANLAGATLSLTFNVSSVPGA